MTKAPQPAADLASTSGRPRWRRALLWGLLIALLTVAQALLLFLVLNYESSRAQDRTEAVAAGAADAARQILSRTLQSLQLLVWSDRAGDSWHQDAAELMRQRREVLRVERRDAAFLVVDAVQAPYASGLFDQLPRELQSIDAEAACAGARRSGAPSFSRSYYTLLAGGTGLEALDLCIPLAAPGGGSMIAVLSLPEVLDAALVADSTRTHELSFVEGDGTRLARAGSVRSAGVYHAERVVDLPGVGLLLRAASAEGRPHLIPNLSVALVFGLSLGLMALVLLLARDVRRRAEAEERLGEALAFRKAMEDSLVTGLRARDLAGRITYVNPAFCRMVGFAPDELLAAAHPPYWPPERVDDYMRRQAERLGTVAAPAAAGNGPAQVGYETVFMRKNGERFPVLLYEAPLVDTQGRHTGWMSATVDLSEQRRIEDMSRQQQERLQATARLATVGEMASLLSHELNQPLAAISSYASGSLNLLDPVGAPEGTELVAADRAMLRQALSRIAEQAERAGRTIKSVHDFVRRREQAHEAISVAVLIDAVLPLVRLQAHKSGTRVEVDCPTPAPRVRADRTMIEQVLLNLTRNGIQAMETDDTATDARLLRVGVRPIAGQGRDDWVEFTVRDAGPGIQP
ncbi:MAG: PAS domain S-box protein, partial [Aquincola sp.]|nr:PAS domain S-box protein [Aquincola sp.]